MRRETGGMLTRNPEETAGSTRDEEGDEAGLLTFEQEGLEH